jgi:MFS family permease
MFGGIVFVPMYMQAILGVSATEAGSSMTPMTFAVILASVISGRLLLKLTFRTVLVIGMVLTAVSFYMMSTLNPDSTVVITYLYMIVMGLGMGLVLPTIMLAVQDQFPKEQLGAVTAASTFFRAIGGTVGITVLSVIMNKEIQSNIKNTLADEAVKSNVKSTLEGIGTDSDNLFQVMINPLALKDIAKEVAEQVVITIKTVWSDSFSMMFLIGLIIIFVGILISLAVGSGRIKSDKELKREAASSAEATETL